MKRVLTCAACSGAHNLEPCSMCGAALCSRHRYGTGSLADGYSCKDCLGKYFVAAVQVPPTPTPGLSYALVWLALGILLFLLVITSEAGAP